MQQLFNIKSGSVLPILRMEIIKDGRSDISKFFEAIQNADITFTMTSTVSNIVKVANAPCYVKEREIDGCVEEYVICYDWKKRDTKESGVYEGVFTIKFGEDITSDDVTFPNGGLVMPIGEKLIINILP